MPISLVPSAHSAATSISVTIVSSSAANWAATQDWDPNSLCEPEIVSPKQQKYSPLGYFAPILLKMPGVNPVWLGIMMAVNLQTSYMHPPLGPTLFYLRGVAPPEVTTRDIYLGIIPFVLIQLAMLVALWFLPELATWLPHRLYGS